MKLVSIQLPDSGLTGELYMSLIVMGIMLILCIVVAIMSHFTDPFKKPKGLLLLAQIYVQFIDNMVEDNMGPQFKKVSPYLGFVCMYIFLSFIVGMIGLPGPFTFLIVPLSISLVTFIAIHVTSMIYTRFRYFKRFIEPIFFFFPINLISMWAPLLSLSFRLFGNALAGWVLMYVVYGALEGLSNTLFSNPFVIAPFITPVLHAYFDMFSGFIQTTVFVFLTMVFISNEVPDDYVYQKRAVNI